jgi:hypothetical protein
MRVGCGIPVRPQQALHCSSRFSQPRSDMTGPGLMPRAREVALMRLAPSTGSPTPSVAPEFMESLAFGRAAKPREIA